MRVLCIATKSHVPMRAGAAEEDDTFESRDVSGEADGADDDGSAAAASSATDEKKQLSKEKAKSAQQKPKQEAAPAKATAKLAAKRAVLIMGILLFVRTPTETPPQGCLFSLKPQLSC